MEQKKGIKKKDIKARKKKYKRKNQIKKFIIILIFILIIFLLFKGIKNICTKIGNKIDDNTNIETEEIQEDKTITLTAIGDIMCHNTQYKDAYKNGTYDFSYVFENIKPYIENSDIAIGNLETTFNENKQLSSYPTFNSPKQLVKNLKDIGLDVLTTANNHSLDTGYGGIEGTIKLLDENEIAHTGTFISEEEQNKILYKDVNGINIAILAYTYGTNGISIPNGKEYCINLIDKELIKQQLDEAKKEDPDIICVSMHWGVEYNTKQNSEQEELANFLFENGVDIILGSHPHVLQPMEKRTITQEDGSSREGFLIYSLGNFISGQVKDNTKDTIILTLKLTKNGETGKISIDDVSYVPVYNYSVGSKKFKLLDIKKEIENYDNGIEGKVSSDTYKKIKTELEKINKIINFEN